MVAFFPFWMTRVVEVFPPVTSMRVVGVFPLVRMMGNFSLGRTLRGVGVVWPLVMVVVMVCAVVKTCLPVTIFTRKKDK